MQFLSVFIQNGVKTDPKGRTVQISQGQGHARKYTSLYIISSICF